MAAVKYHDILSALKLVFESDSRTADAPVYVEKDPPVDVLGAQRAIILMLDSRKPNEDQPIAAGKRVRWELKLSVWAAGYAIDVDEAAAIRDELLGQIELVLLANRTIRDKVASSWMMGGNFISIAGESNIFASAETIVVCDVTASLG